MFFLRTLRRVWSLVVLSSVAVSAIPCGFVPLRQASGQAANSSSKWIDFDIPSQSLAGALNAYGNATHVQLFVDSSLTSGRRSAALHGVFTPEAALLGLISGTGLTTLPIGSEGFTLVPVPEKPTREGGTAPELGPRSALRFADYSARLQRELTFALCSGEVTRPGNYRTLVRLWLGPSGSVRRADILTSTGDSARDDLLLNALRSLVVGEAPPQGLPQPITLLLTPGAKPSEGYCPPTNNISPRQADVTP